MRQSQILTSLAIVLRARFAPYVAMVTVHQLTREYCVRCPHKLAHCPAVVKGVTDCIVLEQLKELTPDA